MKELEALERLEKAVNGTLIINIKKEVEIIKQALTELERLQKFNDVIAIIESGYKAIESGEAFANGFPESRLIPSNWNGLCLKAVLDDIIEEITPLIKEYLQDELTYQEIMNDRD